MESSVKNGTNELDVEPPDRNGVQQKATSEVSIYESAENLSSKEVTNPSLNNNLSFSDDIKDFVNPIAEKLDDHVNSLNLTTPGTKSNDSSSWKITDHCNKKEELETCSIASFESAVFFNDGRRRIDFVLVFSTDDTENHDSFSTARSIFENNLKDEGLHLEHACQEEMGLVFVKIHAPWDVLSRYGEILKFKMPMKECLFDDIRRSERVPDFDYSKYYPVNNYMTAFDHSVSDIYLPDDPNFKSKKVGGYSTVYTRDKEYLFEIPSKKEDFFSPAQRSRIVQFILKRKNFTDDPTDVFGFGIKKLLADGIYTAAYPLHEGDLADRSSSNPRWFLLQHWAGFKCIFKKQPLNEIRHYFGVKIGLYFAWLGFYTYMLIPASVVGILCFIYGCVTVHTNIPSNEICTSDLLMCPRCDDECHYWYLKESCTAAKVTYLVDNAATVFFAIFMSLWGAVFLEMWKRYSADITHQWDLTGFDTSEEHPRPEYLARLSNERKKKMNYITRMYEPHVPFWRRRLPYSVMSTSIVLLLITIALAAVAGVILYRISVNAALLLLDDKRVTTFASIITSTTAAMLNLICIMIFNQFYTKIASYLTELELHRTQTEFDDSLTLKMFLLQFVNYYSSIFYIAFFKGKLVGHPGNYNLLFGYRQEECGTGGCLMELTIQLAIIMVGKQALNNIVEMAVPWFSWLYQWYTIKKRRWGSRNKKKHVNTRWEEDYVLADWGPTHLFFEYLEMILQFGFVTIFVAAFPLAPFFALVNNVLEIRLDARKLVTTYKRPVGVRVKNIGIWYRILDSIGKLAVLSNGIIIAFTSDMIPRLVYKWTVTDDHSLTGFVNYSLAYFNTSDFPSYVTPRPLFVNSSGAEVELCRYRDFRDPPWSNNKYDFNETYWHLLAVRLAFVLLFENVILMTTTLVRWLIPDVPKKLREQIRHENFITNEIMIAQELRRAKGFSVKEYDLHQENDHRNDIKMFRSDDIDIL